MQKNINSCKGGVGDAIMVLTASGVDKLLLDMTLWKENIRLAWSQRHGPGPGLAPSAFDALCGVDFQGWHRMCPGRAGSILLPMRILGQF